MYGVQSECQFSVLGDQCVLDTLIKEECEENEQSGAMLTPSFTGVHRYPDFVVGHDALPKGSCLCPAPGRPGRDPAPLALCLPPPRKGRAGFYTCACRHLVAQAHLRTKLQVSSFSV